MKGIGILGLSASLLCAHAWADNSNAHDNGVAALTALMFSKRSFEESRWCFYGSQIVGEVAEARLAGKTKAQAEEMLGPNLPEKIQDAVNDAFAYKQPGPGNAVDYFDQCSVKAENSVKKDIDELASSSS
ncbi:hypothetical protein [Pseudomonas typographi]|uniref:Lipoprotein n=1 Tax=Pseudomonas typographi TaxID=2715964 RepID=A0ABR7ZA89_9PSED|nr:hypothetical protein [Pseudomonas typographi]MBD1602470.1 hypothetical protein [Pseudomonas typographi]